MMIAIHCGALEQSASSLGKYVQRLEKSSSEVQSILRSTCAWRGQALTGELQRAIAAIDLDAQNVRNLQKTAETSLQLYTHCERGIARVEVEEAPSASTEVPPSPSAGIDWSSLVKIFGNFGTIGGVASALFGTALNPVSLGKNLAKLVGTGAKMAAKISDRKTIDLFGTSTVNAIGFRENLAAKLDGYVVNGSYNSANASIAAKNASKISAVAQWAGVAITGLTNFASNVEEFQGDLSSPRLYAETAVETVVDVGTGLLIGAGVAAAAGAAAPVWAVGVVSTGIGMFADWGSKAITGKGLTELVSDTVLDLHKIVSGIKTTAGKAVSSAADKVSVGWRKLKDWFGR